MPAGSGVAESGGGLTHGVCFVCCDVDATSKQADLVRINENTKRTLESEIQGFKTEAQDMRKVRRLSCRCVALVVLSFNYYYHLPSIGLSLRLRLHPTHAFTCALSVCAYGFVGESRKCMVWRKSVRSMAWRRRKPRPST